MRKKPLSHIVIEVSPVRIGAFDQLDLPRPSPFLDLLFAKDRLGHRFVEFDIDEKMNAVGLGDSVERSGPMVPHPRHDLRRHADIEGAVSLAGENIDAWAPHPRFLSSPRRKPGSRGNQRALATLDPGFRRDDGRRTRCTERDRLPRYRFGKAAMTSVRLRWNLSTISSSSARVAL